MSKAIEVEVAESPSNKNRHRECGGWLKNN